MHQLEGEVGDCIDQADHWRPAGGGPVLQWSPWTSAPPTALPAHQSAHTRVSTAYAPTWTSSFLASQPIYACKIHPYKSVDRSLETRYKYQILYGAGRNHINIINERH